jgi:NitT/TauT family transport system permease protein
MSIVRDVFSLPRRLSYADLVVFGILGGLMYWMVLVSREWSQAIQPHTVIHSEFIYLPLYTLYSLSRGLGAYIISLLFTIAYGYIMAHSKRAEKVMLSLLDILQSVPIVAFLPELVTVFVLLFPNSYVGLEIASVITIFTGQVWNMTFAFYHSIKAIPQDLKDATESYHLTKRETLRRLELPASAIPLIWNSMMSMAGGWFFLSLSEAFTVGGKDFRLPGIGSYMAQAVEQGNIPSMIGAMIAMGLMIIFLDRVLWRPLVIWSRKFRVEELSSEPEGKSFVLSIIQRSEMIQSMNRWFERRRRDKAGATEASYLATKEALSHDAFDQKVETDTPFRKAIGVALAVIVLGLLAYGVFRLYLIFTQEVTAAEWLDILSDSFLTLLRVMAALAIGAAWAVPAGIMIGMNAKWSHRLQPVVQFMSSFPAPLVFPIFILLFREWGISIEYGSIVLMLLGTQWYLLFNVIGGASAIPTDLQEMSASYRITKKSLWRKLLLPAVFPSVVTGAITAAGGAWNASIVAEFVEYHHNTYAAHGIGALLQKAFEDGHYALLGAGIFALCLMVICLNKFVWRKLFAIAQDRFALNV